MRKIVVYPKKILRQKSDEVLAVDDGLVDEVNDLTKMLAIRGNMAAGLAANQIGVRKRFFGMRDLKSGTTRVFVNPVILVKKGKKDYLKIESDGKVEDFLEGCLSFPNLFGKVKRHYMIEGWWQELVSGKLVEKRGEFEGFEAVVFQHELDHLDGVLFIDHILAEGERLYEWNGKEMKVAEFKF